AVGCASPYTTLFRSDVARGLAEAPSFRYGSGPTQRFVIELDPNGLKVENALPGGAVADPDSPHFADQAEAWRRNETFAIPFYQEDRKSTRLNSSHVK